MISWEQSHVTVLLLSDTSWCNCSCMAKHSTETREVTSEANGHTRDVFTCQLFNWIFGILTLYVISVMKVGRLRRARERTNQPTRSVAARGDAGMIGVLITSVSSCPWTTQSLDRLVHVSTAWRVLMLRMEERPSDMQGSRQGMGRCEHCLAA